MVLALCVAAGALALGLYAAAGVRDSVFAEAGKLAAEKLNGGTAGIGQNGEDGTAWAIEGKDFSISKEYFDLTVREFILTGADEETAKELAEKTLIEKFSLYAMAEKENCVAGEEQVAKVIRDTRDGLEKAGNKSDFYDYLEGMGLDEEAYWESQFENIKIYESIAILKETHRNRFAAENGTADGAEWDSYWKAVTDGAIEEQNITVFPE